MYFFKYTKYKFNSHFIFLKNLKTKLKEKQDFKLWNRSAFIYFFREKKIKVYNGKLFYSFLVKKNMFGKRYGDFSFPKKKAVFLKKKNNLIKKKK